jgi:hypothetical protein
MARRRGVELERRGRDSNPRYGCPYAAFRVRCIQPLCHLSNYLILIAFLLSHLAARWPFAPFCSQFSLEARLFTAARNGSSTRVLGDFFCWIGLCLRVGASPRHKRGSPFSSLLGKICSSAKQFATYKARWPDHSLRR